KRWEKIFAETELASFTFNPAPDAAPVLGSVDANGELRLNMGPRAGERLIGDTVDGDEHFTVAPGSAANEVVVTFHSPSGPVTQTFTNVSRIVADGGEGNDTIFI